MTDKVYFYIAGGFGDIVFHYIRGTGYWDYLEPLGRARPDIQIKAICCGHNDQVLEFLKYNPFLGSAEHIPLIGDYPPPLKDIRKRRDYFLSGDRRDWNRDLVVNKDWWDTVPYEDCSKGYTWIGEATELLEGLEPLPTKVYLSDSDKEILDNVTQAGPYIAIHPFAGCPSRITLPPKEYYKLIDTLIDEHGYNVAVLGGNHARIGQDGGNHYSETFTYQRDGLYNLVNQTNGRVSVKLVESSSKFIGCWSCYSSAAWGFDKHFVIVTNLSRKKDLEKISKNENRRQGDCRGVYIDAKNNPNYDRVRAEIVREVL